MNYYYQNDNWAFSEYFSSSPKDFLFSKKYHKRIIFSLVALYISFRLSCYFIRLFSGLFRWATEYSPQREQHMQPSQPRVVRLLEGTFITLFGLGVGAVAYYAHQKQSWELLDTISVTYVKMVNLIVYHSTGFDLSRSSLNPNETLVVGSILAGVIVYFMLGLVRFVLYHYIFGFGLVLLGIVLYFYQIPITAATAANYQGSMFIIDHKNYTATLVPVLIPKALFALTIVYYLFLILLKSFTLFLKLSFRFLLYSLIASILLNSVTSLLNEPSGSFETTSTTFTPDHRF